MSKLEINPELDLYFERIVDVPPTLVWKAWTVPEHILPWFCPLPWKTVEAEVDLRPALGQSRSRKRNLAMNVQNFCLQRLFI